MHFLNPILLAGLGAVTIPIHEKNFTPEEVSAEVLKKLKAEATLNTKC